MEEKEKDPLFPNGGPDSPTEAVRENALAVEVRVGREVSLTLCQRMGPDRLPRLYVPCRLAPVGGTTASTEKEVTHLYSQ